MHSLCMNVVWLVVLASTPISIAAAVDTYYVTDLGDLPGGNGGSWARDVNSMGQVVGSTSISGNAQAFLWHPDTPNAVTGQMHALQDLEDGGFSLAFALNDRGQVVGRSSTESDERGFLWHPDLPNGTSGSAHDLGSLPGGSGRSGALGINRVGQVVGSAHASSGVRAFLWQPAFENSTTGELVDLGELPGGEDYSVAHDINDLGYVVGSSWAEIDRQPFAWLPTTPNASTGTLVNLGDLEGGRAEGAAIGLSNGGQIVGHSSAAKGFSGFRTDLEAQVGVLNDLGDLAGGNDYSLARDVNDQGQIVGVGTDEDGFKAVTWTTQDRLIDLNDLLDPVSSRGWKLNYASGINNSGQIVGYGTLDGMTRAFLLTPIPVPTPGSSAIAASQMVLAATVQRRRRGSLLS